MVEESRPNKKKLFDFQNNRDQVVTTDTVIVQVRFALMFILFPCNYNVTRCRFVCRIGTLDSVPFMSFL